MLHNQKYILFILLQSLIYGFGNPLTKIAYENIGPFSLLFFRFSLATLVFLCFFPKRIITPLRNTKLSAYIIPSICMSIAYISCNLALNLTSATNVGFLMSLPVIIAPIFATIFLKEHYSIKFLIVQLAVLLGLFLLCRNGGNFSLNNGDICALITAAAIAGSLVFGKETLKQVDAIFLSAIQCALTALFSLPGMLLFEQNFRINNISIDAWLVILYLAITCSVLSFILQNLALTKLSSGFVALLQCTQPVMTALISWCLLGEILSWEGISGAVLIICCLIMQSLWQLKNDNALALARNKST